MEPRPTIALILRALIFVSFQFLAYKSYGLPVLIVAWAVIIITTWIDVKTMVAKVSQTVVQTAWLVVILALIHSEQIRI
jgi:hypothetical protein